MDVNFVKADSRNLPKVDAIMLEMFFKNNPDFYSAELRIVKTAMAARESYGYDAIGHVQLRCGSGHCTLNCKIYPKHKVRASSYKVTMVIDETKGEIVSCQFLDCAASAGACKHAVTFLIEEPSCTDVECYLKKPILSRVGTTMKYVTVDQICKKTAPRHKTSSDLFYKFLQEAKKKKIMNCELLKYQNDFKHSDVRQFSLYHFLIQASDDIKKDFNKLLETLQEKLNKNALDLIKESSQNQCKSPLWYDLRYALITASKAYEVSRCQTPDGSLVAAIMGAKTPDTSAMKRGLKLESSVIKLCRVKLKPKSSPVLCLFRQSY